MLRLIAVFGLHLFMILNSAQLESIVSLEEWIIYSEQHVKNNVFPPNDPLRRWPPRDVEVNSSILGCICEGLNSAQLESIASLKEKGLFIASDMLKMIIPPNDPVQRGPLGDVEVNSSILVAFVDDS